MTYLLIWAALVVAFLGFLAYSFSTLTNDED
jgi:hypothetical protein